jgi:hypothetical protein
VAARFSCQGVSGKVQFQGRDLLVVSPHEEFAYVSFVTLGQAAYEAIVELLSEFLAITDANLPGRPVLHPVLRSTGDNIRFRQELHELATLVLERVMTGDERSRL